ncbi:lipocalin family protein [Halomonas alkalisoli]|nr:lipocalin family protein [Halomonas alkalisoli]MCE9684579.1 lipocalin family protein [Halomonas alkalisoli]
MTRLAILGLLAVLGARRDRHDADSGENRGVGYLEMTGY